MDFDKYWDSLIKRVYHERVELHGDEEHFYRLSCIYGETMVDGIESYFERRFDQFVADMNALRNAGFGELASEYESARILVFGAAPLDPETVDATIMKLLDETEESEPVLAELSEIYERVIPQLLRLADYKYSFGINAGLFSDA